MVDCGNSRCIQDRRVLKKELLTWTKKVPLLVGLETIAKGIVGKKMFDTVFPFSDLEPEETDDWKPQDSCTFCEDRAKFMIDVVQESLDQDGNGADNPAIRYLQQLLPLAYPPNILPDPSQGEDKPLDLSASSWRSSRSLLDTSSLNKPTVELKVPNFQSKLGKKREFSGKRNYTDEELTAAVSDIKSGKIGTRRAAALYGIPRSTLRNKIFRMDGHSCGDVAEANKLSMGDLLQSETVPHEPRYPAHTPDEWDRQLEKVRRKHDLNAGLDRPFGMPPLFYNAHHMMECEKAFRMSDPYSYDLKLPYLHELVQKFVRYRLEVEQEQRNEEQRYPADLRVPTNVMRRSTDSSTSSSSDSNGLMYQVELKIPSYRPVRSCPSNGDLSPGAEDQSASATGSGYRIGETLKDIIAKSIAEKVRSRAQNNSGSIGSFPGLQYQNGVGDDYADTETGRSAAEPVAKKPRLQSGLDKRYRDSESGRNTNEDMEQKMSKKTRPKRGQYRKYNSELLMEAVRAVQRGEMSVHRAGSYFGVPHSTLEYKVKERHLLRQKKPRENRKKATVESTNSGSTSASSTRSSPVLVSSYENPDEDTKSEQLQQQQQLLLGQPSGLAPAPAAAPVPMPSYPLAGHIPFAYGWPPLINGGLPLSMHEPLLGAAYSPGFRMNTSASDLLKKLQKKVQAKTSLGDSDEELGISSNSQSTKSRIKTADIIVK